MDNWNLYNESTYEVNGNTYRNLEAQVRKTKDDAEINAENIAILEENIQELFDNRIKILVITSMGDQNFPFQEILDNSRTMVYFIFYVPIQRIYIFHEQNLGKIYFSCVHTSTIKYIEALRTSAITATLSMNSQLLEGVNNKTTLITANSTDIQYPSALAVYNYVNSEKTTKIITINETGNQDFPFDEIIANMDKILYIVNYNGFVYKLFQFTTSFLKFTGIGNYISHWVDVARLTATTATVTPNSLNLEYQQRMTQAISSSSTTAQYPSAKAVYDYVNSEKTTKIITINETGNQDFPFDEIIANMDKILYIVNYNGFVYKLFQFTTSFLKFTGIGNYTSRWVNVARLTATTATVTPDSLNLEYQQRMIQAISSSSTTAQYPSAKAVYDYVIKANRVIELTSISTSIDFPFPYAEILANYNKYTYIIKYNNNFYTLARNDSGILSFVSTNENLKVSSISIFPSTDTTATGQTEEFTAQLIDRMDQTITSTSSTGRYPSSKAVYNALLTTSKAEIYIGSNTSNFNFPYDDIINNLTGIADGSITDTNLSRDITIIYNSKYYKLSGLYGSQLYASCIASLRAFQITISRSSSTQAIVTNPQEVNLV